MDEVSNETTQNRTEPQPTHSPESKTDEPSTKSKNTEKPDDNSGADDIVDKTRKADDSNSEHNHGSLARSDKNNDTIQTRENKDKAIQHNQKYTGQHSTSRYDELQEEPKPDTVRGEIGALSQSENGDKTESGTSVPTNTENSATKCKDTSRPRVLHTQDDDSITDEPRFENDFEQLEEEKKTGTTSDDAPRNPATTSKRRKLSQSDSSTSTIEELERHIKTLRQENKSQTEDLAKHTALISNISEQNATLKINYERLLEENNKNVANIQSLQEKDRTNNREIKSLKGQVTQMRGENESTLSQVKQLESDKEKNAKIMKKRDAEIVEFKQMLSKEKDKFKATEKELKEEKKGVSKLQQDMKTMNQQYKDWCDRKETEYKTNLDTTKRQYEQYGREQEQFWTAIQASLNEQIHKQNTDHADLLLRYSKLAGDSLTMGNPNVTDLSDPNRPTKLAEQFSELYDNEWTDAFEELDNMSDDEKIKFLLKILQRAYELSTDITATELNRCYYTTFEDYVDSEINVNEEDFEKSMGGEEDVGSTKVSGPHINPDDTDAVTDPSNTPNEVQKEESPEGDPEANTPALSTTYVQEGELAKGDPEAIAPAVNTTDVNNGQHTMESGNDNNLDFSSAGESATVQEGELAKGDPEAIAPAVNTADVEKDSADNQPTGTAVVDPLTETNPFLEVEQDTTTSDVETKSEDIKEGTETSNNSSDANKVKSSEEIKGEQNSKTKTEKGTPSSEKSDTSNDDAKQTQELNSTENSETTENGQTPQSSETDEQTEQGMDTTEKMADGGKPPSTPARVSPTSVLALTAKAAGYRTTTKKELVQKAKLISFTVPDKESKNERELASIKMFPHIRKKVLSCASNKIHTVITECLVQEFNIPTQKDTCVVKFVNKCSELCLMMGLKDPPLYIDFLKADSPEKHIFSTDRYKAYTKKGMYLLYLVWPCLYLEKDGPLLSKGTAQGGNV